MRKLLFHLNCFEQGGAERVVSNLVNQLVQEDYEVIAATEWQGEVEFALDPKVRRISVGLRPEDVEKSRIAKIYLRFAYLHRLIREEKPDVVISFTRRPNYRALVSAIGTHVPVIPAVRQDPKSYYNTWADKLLMPTLYRLAKGCVFQTAEQMSYFPKSLQKRSRIILNPVNDKYLQGIIYALHTHAGVPHEMIEWHGHNDFYKAVVKSTTAWLYGCSGVNTSLFGIGERTGNTPLEAMVFEYAQLKGDLNGMDTTVITELAEYYEKEIGYHIPERTPFVGKNFNVTRAGVHADGLLKNEEIYNIFDTDKFLNRPALCAVSNTSGLAGIAHWINTYFKLKAEKQLDKSSPLVAEVKKWVDKQYEEGRVTVITDAELIEQIAIACKRLDTTIG